MSFKELLFEASELEISETDAYLYNEIDECLSSIESLIQGIDNCLQTSLTEAKESACEKSKESASNMASRLSKQRGLLGGCTVVGDGTAQVGPTNARAKAEKKKKRCQEKVRNAVQKTKNKLEALKKNSKITCDQEREKEKAKSDADKKAADRDEFNSKVGDAAKGVISALN